MTLSFARFQMRRGLAADWTAANTILEDGEEGYETDTGKRKVGDGSTAWTGLPYADGGGSSPLAWHGPFTVTKDTPDGTPLGLTIAAGSMILGLSQVTREDFDSGMYLAVDSGLAGGYIEVGPLNQFGSIGPGTVFPNWTRPQGGPFTDVTTDAPLLWTSAAAGNTTGDMDVWILVAPSPQ